MSPNRLGLKDTERMIMKFATSARLAAALLLAGVASAGFAQATTNVPAPVAGAQAVTVQHIKVHAPTI